MVFIPFGSGFHFYTSASDLALSGDVIMDRLFQVICLRRPALPIQPVSPAVRRHLCHAEPTVAGVLVVVVFNELLAEFHEEYRQRSFPRFFVVQVDIE